MDSREAHGSDLFLSTLSHPKIRTSVISLRFPVYSLISETRMNADLHGFFGCALSPVRSLQLRTSTAPLVSNARASARPGYICADPQYQPLTVFYFAAQEWNVDFRGFGGSAPKSTFLLSEVCDFGPEQPHSLPSASAKPDQICGHPVHQPLSVLHCTTDRSQQSEEKCQ